jgi:hypothetical protein
MKTILIIPVVLLLLVQSSNAQFKIPQVLKNAANTVNPGNPSPAEMGSALKEALEIGVSAGADRLSLENGFLGNEAVKLFFRRK